ncbi:MAG TPA: helix-turn-helix domain-containing protein [Labilithrix sp.]|nr:helix-turn-helix domain-containing protein [Labilithrix sp.]
MAKRESGEVRRPQIADAALRIIARHGLARFTTAAIAEEVGITEGSIFRHFASKSEIVLAAIDRIEELFNTAAPPAALDPIEQLGSFMAHRMRVVHKNAGVARLLFSEDLSFAAGPAGAARVRAIRARGAVHIRKYLHEAQTAGILAPGLDLDALLLLVHGAAMALVFSDAPGDPRRTARVWKTLEQLLRRAPGSV